MNACVKYFQKILNTWIFLVNDEEILEKYHKIWNKITNLFNKKLDSEPMYDDKYEKAQINLH